MASEKKVTIVNETGLHARPASQFVKKAGKFKSDIKIVFEDKEVNAKSIMGVMSLGIGQGKEITLKADGEDEKKALDSLEDFIITEMAEEDN
ncbi:phosphocarrier protein HPr [Halanaerobium sp.]|uniref:phosphocarrier protein HPr n=1 Tax=Halanaerobium sp. TaxID=1895664 RepID=UPI000796455C|nr:phosphocarrier protein HPr [Halanaerobium sp.]KXS47228.1 MAG: phosphocarrier protein [Halanaerobium sp. T82-1]PUU86350.1 MAG: phosphocarrier protein [Halanaerobium sp.]